VRAVLGGRRRNQGIPGQRKEIRVRGEKYMSPIFETLGYVAQVQLEKAMRALQRKARIQDGRGLVRAVYCGRQQLDVDCDLRQFRGVRLRKLEFPSLRIDTRGDKTTKPRDMRHQAFIWLKESLNLRQVGRAVNAVAFGRF
jgi:hypothetical protein